MEQRRASWAKVRCAKCRTNGKAWWDENAQPKRHLGKHDRKLTELTSGFFAVDKGKDAGPTVFCQKCKTAATISEAEK